MRERLVGSFVLFAVFIAVAFGVVRAYALTELVKQSEASKLDRSVVLMAALIGTRVDGGKVFDTRQLGEYLDRGQRIEYTDVDGRRTVATTPTYVIGSTESDVSSSAKVAGGGSLRIQQSGVIVDERVAEAVLPVVQLALLLIAVAIVVGYVLAVRLSRPFQELARIAEKFGSGEFDTVIPRFSIHEANSVGQSMRDSEIRLKKLMRREREFASNASHQLRTPITALHLELEDLALWDETPPIVAEELRRSVLELDRLNAAVTSLLDMARGKEIVAGPAVDLSELVIKAALRWRPQVTAVKRQIWAASPKPVMTRSPKGPINQILDVLIENSIKHGVGLIELGTAELDTHLRLRVSDQGTAEIDRSVFARRVQGSESDGEGIGLSMAAELAVSLGGFLSIGDGTKVSFDLMLLKG